VGSIKGYRGYRQDKGTPGDKCEGGGNRTEVVIRTESNRESEGGGRSRSEAYRGSPKKQGGRWEEAEKGRNYGLIIQGKERA